MKTRINKKYYNFTEKQKRNDTHRLVCFHFHTVGKEMKVLANKKFRRENNRILKEILNKGKDKPFVKYCKYMWWDC
ncbi:hypothetical protein AVL50_09925 [Flammeovirga sp. SJP92]|nr:hypothetical protein AVL50_09925 [Flammeovirga sp. SJP92]